MDGNTQTIVVQVQPAPASEQNIDLYLSMFWTFFGVLLVIWTWKKVEYVFNTNNEN
jgi:hypothetical protein